MQTVRETVEWRFFSIIVTFIVTYFWTGEFFEASALTIILNLSKMIAYYIWRKWKLGHWPIVMRKLKYALSSRRKINQ